MGERLHCKPSRGEYVASADEPAGIGWCEAIVWDRAGVTRHCYTFASSVRDGREVCGLHGERVRFGPPRPGVQQER